MEIQSLNNDIAAKSSQLQALTEQLSSLAPYANFPLDAYQQIQDGLSQAERQLPKQSDSITKRAFDWLNVTSDKLVFKHLANRLNAAVLNTLATAHPFQIPLDRLSLTTAVTSVNQKLDFSQQWQNLNRKVTEIQTQRTALVTVLSSLIITAALHPLSSFAVPTIPVVCKSFQMMTRLQQSSISWLTTSRGATPITLILKKSMP